MNAGRQRTTDVLVSGGALGGLAQAMVSGRMAGAAAAECG